MNVVMINNIDLDRDKILDESIFLAICARDLIKRNDKITSPIRLQLAINGLQKCLEKLEEEREEDE